MNNRFVGDIGDYVKLAILRRLALDRRLGVAWWFTDDEPPSAHQGHREYLERPQQWRHFDAELFDALVEISKCKRDTCALENAGLLPNAVFAGDKIPQLQPFKDRPAAREKWLSGITKVLEGCDLVFLDPDNGIAPEGLRPTRRCAGKSVFVQEISTLTENQRAIVVYHHQSRRQGGHLNEIRYLAQLLVAGGLRVSGVLRAKPWSPRAFFILNGDEQLCERANETASAWGNLMSWHVEDEFQTKSCDVERPKSASG